MQRLQSLRTERKDKYDMVLALTGAQRELTLGQLWNGDVTTARKELE